MAGHQLWGLLLGISLVTIGLGGLALADCPEVCTCKWKGGKQTVECINASLSSIPSLEAGTQVLDLSLNYLPTLRTDTFSKHNLTNLQKIYLPRCSLRILEVHTFRWVKFSGFQVNKKRVENDIIHTLLNACTFNPRLASNQQMYYPKNIYDKTLHYSYACFISIILPIWSLFKISCLLTTTSCSKFFRASPEHQPPDILSWNFYKMSTYLTLLLLVFACSEF